MTKKSYVVKGYWRILKDGRKIWVRPHIRELESKENNHKEVNTNIIYDGNPNDISEFKSYGNLMPSENEMKGFMLKHQNIIKIIDGIGTGTMELNKFKQLMKLNGNK